MLLKLLKCTLQVSLNAHDFSLIGSLRVCGDLSIYLLSLWTGVTWLLVDLLKECGFFILPLLVHVYHPT